MATTPATSEALKRPWTAALLWPLATLLSLLGCLLITGCILLSGNSPSFPDPWLNLMWLILLLPAALLFWLLGTLQQRGLKLDGLNVANQWAKRTVIGGLLGMLAYLLVMWIVRTLYDAGPLVSPTSVVFVSGDRVEIGAIIAGWMLVGAVLGFAQWTPWRFTGRERWMGIGWSIASAAAWGAGSVVNWVVFKQYVIQYEPICITCIQRFIVTISLTALTIAIAGAIALISRIGSVAFSILVVAYAATLLPSTPVPAFSTRNLYAHRVLETDETQGYVEAVGFANDGTFFAVLKSEKSMGVNIREWVVIWRTSDWSVAARIDYGGTSARLATPPWEYAEAELTPEWNIEVRRKPDNLLLHTIGLRTTPAGSLPQGYAFTSTGSSRHSVLITPSGERIPLSAHPVRSYHSPNEVAYDISPDGRYIGAGYKFGGIWIWRVP